MRTLIENYELFEKLVNVEKIYMDPTLRFCDICALLEVPTGSLDALLMEELGTDGDTLLDNLRRAVPERLERVYHLSHT